LNNIHDTAAEQRRILTSRDMKFWIPWEEANLLFELNTFHRWRGGRREKKILPIYPGCYQLRKAVWHSSLQWADNSGLANVGNSFIPLVKRTW